MKRPYLKILLLLVFILLWQGLHAQEVQSTDEFQKLEAEVQDLKDASKPGRSRFLLRGYAHSGLQLTQDEFSFVGGSFNPLFIYKQSDRLLFESEVEFELEDGVTVIGLEYANMSYLLSKTLTLRAGKILVPFGIFVPNLHPAWVNKFATAPLGVGHDGIVPSNDIGLELRGGSYLGNLKINYSFYAVNGSQLNDGSEDPEEAGILHHAVFPDNNRGKTIGGRLGVFPFSNSSVELGISGMYGKVGTRDTPLEDINSLHYAFDFSYVQNVPGLSSVIDLKAQYSALMLDQAQYPDPEDTSKMVSFDNNSMAWFAQFSIRPALVENKFVRRLEFAARYSALKTPESAAWEADETQLDLGINYWVDWRTVLKVGYRISTTAAEEHAEPGHDEITGNAFFVHWAIGF